MTRSDNSHCFVGDGLQSADDGHRESSPLSVPIYLTQKPPSNREETARMQGSQHTGGFHDIGILKHAA